MDHFYVEEENKIIAQTGLQVWLQYFNSLDSSVKPHIHTAIEILIIAKGNFRVITDGVEHILEPGDAVLFRPYTIHQVYPLCENESSYMVIKMKPSFVFDMSSFDTGAGYLLNLSLHEQNFKTVWKKEECDKNNISLSVSRLEKESISGGYCSDISMKIAAAEIILTMLRDTEPQNSSSALYDATHENLAKRIYNSTVYINKHYSDDITAEETAKLVFMSYSYFSRSFKRITGQTFKDFLNLTRINHAEKALLSSEESITKIASECGFNSVSYFISIFKKNKGISPSKYRELNKK